MQRRSIEVPTGLFNDIKKDRTDGRFCLICSLVRDRNIRYEAEDSHSFDDGADLTFIVVDRRIGFVRNRLFGLVILGLSDFS